MKTSMQRSFKSTLKKLEMLEGQLRKDMPRHQHNQHAQRPRFFKPSINTRNTSFHTPNFNFNNNDNQDPRNPFSNNKILINEIKELRKELEKLRAAEHKAAMKAAAAEATVESQKEEIEWLRNALINKN